MENVIRVENGKYIAGKASGESVHANVLTKLWENPNPNVAFAAQNITLASDDYDFLLLTYYVHPTDPRMLSVIFTKGKNSLITLGTINGSGSFCAGRAVTSNSVTSINIDSASYCVGTEAPVVNNDFLVPVAIYGFKKSLDISAIVSKVSTDARQCMLSDGVTSVEDKFTLQTSQATAEPGYTLVLNRIRKRTGMCEVLLTLSNFTFAEGSWVKFATVPIKPIDQDCIGTAFNGNTANFLGEARIDPSGNVYVLPQYSVSGIYVTMRFMYFTND